MAVSATSGKGDYYMYRDMQKVFITQIFLL